PAEREATTTKAEPPVADAPAAATTEPKAEPAEPATSETQPATAAAIADGDALPVLRLAPGATAQELADKTSRTAAEIVGLLLGLGEMVSATQSLSDDALELIAHELGYRVEFVGVVEDEEEQEE